MLNQQALGMLKAYVDALVIEVEFLSGEDEDSNVRLVKLAERVKGIAYQLADASEEEPAPHK
jgi:hypothetical protein